MIYYGADVIALGYCLVAKMLIASLIAQILLSIVSGTDVNMPVCCNMFLA